MRVGVIYRSREDDVCVSLAREIDDDPEIINMGNFEYLKKKCKDCDVIFLREINTFEGNLPKFMLSLGKKVVVIK